MKSLENAMEPRAPKVLLIREGPRGSGNLEKYLQKCGCECVSVGSYKDACSLLGARAFDLVLSPMRLQNDSLFPLIKLLNGSPITMFYWIAVDRGCLWLPALRHGLNCFGSSALRTREFVVALEKVIQEIRMRAAVKLEGSAPAGSVRAKRSSAVAV